MEPIALAKLDKCSITKPQPQPWPYSGFLNWWNACCLVFQFIIYLVWSFASVSTISPDEAQFSVGTEVFKPTPHPTQGGLAIPGYTCAFKTWDRGKPLSVYPCPPKTSTPGGLSFPPLGHRNALTIRQQRMWKSSAFPGQFSGLSFMASKRRSLLQPYEMHSSPTTSAKRQG